MESTVCIVLLMPESRSGYGTVCKLKYALRGTQ